MRWFLAAAALLVLGLFAWWWASGTAPRAGPGKREGSGDREPAAAASAADADAPVVEDDEPPPAAAADLGELTLRVVDEAGAAIAGAWIEVRRDERQPVTDKAVADGLGRATVRLTRRDILFVGARGFMRQSVSGALRLAIDTVVLLRSYDFGGIVVDGNGVGIAGAQLTLHEPTLPERVERSGPDGRFAFLDVCDDEMWLDVSAEGFVPVTPLASPGDTDVRIVLRRPIRIDGVVVFPDGSPAAGAKVGGRPADDRGRFTLDGVVPGRRIELWASHEAKDRSWTAMSVVEVAPDGTHDPIRLILEPKERSWVRVKVLKADGSPHAGAILVGASTWLTAADGRALCTFDFAPGTRVLIRVNETRTDGLLPGAAYVMTGPRDGPEVVLSPREPLLVTVVVRGPDGAALPANVPAGIHAYGNRIVRRERDGAVVAVDPLAAEITLTASAPGFADQYVRVPPPADGRLEVRLHGTGSIACRLVDESGAAVNGAFVRAWVRGVGAAEAGEPEADGTFRVMSVPTGRALVTAGYDHDQPLARLEAEVRSGEVTDLGTVVLGSSRALFGRVTDASGRPVGGARVYALEGESEARTFSRSDGTFRVLVSPWFDGFVLAVKPGHGSAYRRASEVLDLVLPQEGKVRLEVRLPPLTQGSRAFSLAARDPATGFRWSRLQSERIEGTTHLVSGLPPGRLILIVATSPKDGETEVVVVPGETVPAVIEVPE